MKTKLLSYSIFAVITASASASVWSQQQNSTDCSTAKEDIAHLQHEKKSTDERSVKGVLGILPIGLVINAASSGSEKHDPKKEMEINEYNKKITERINEIQKNCQVSGSDSVLDESSD